VYTLKSLIYRIRYWRMIRAYKRRVAQFKRFA